MTRIPTPHTWNHRVLLTEQDGEKSYCIHEVHYDEYGVMASVVLSF